MPMEKTWKLAEGWCEVTAVERGRNFHDPLSAPKGNKSETRDALPPDLSLSFSLVGVTRC